MTKRVLIFTYYWPPAGGIAVHRFLKFAKWLPSFAWEPIIVTVSRGSYPYEDSSLASEIAPSLRVHRTRTLEPFTLYNLLRGKRGKELPVALAGSQRKPSAFQRAAERVRANLFVPDARKGWVPFAHRCARAILARERVDALITTGPPHSAHLVGRALRRETSIPWIADLRDPWTNIFYNRSLPRTDRTRRKDRALETSVLETADCVTVISPGMKREFEGRARRIEVVPNGYDEEDFGPAPGRAPDGVFRIRYVGNLMTVQDAPALWRSLAWLAGEGTPCRLEIIGRADDDVRRSLEGHDLALLVDVRGFVPHREAVRLMQGADLLLFLIPRVPGNALIVTGKLFEYLAARAEILAIGPPRGDAAEILRACGRKPMIDFEDEAAMRAQLAAARAIWRDEAGAPRYADDRHAAWSRRAATRSLAGLLDALTSEASPSRRDRTLREAPPR